MVNVLKKRTFETSDEEGRSEAVTNASNGA